MDLSSTPPSLTRSPSATPAESFTSDRSSMGYPSPTMEQQYKISSMYDQPCSMAPPMDQEISLPPLDSMTPDWGSQPVMHQGSSGAVMPSILSAEYESFENYPYSHDVYPHQQHQANQASAMATPPPTASTTRSPMPAPRATLPSYPVSSASMPGSMTPRTILHKDEYSQSIESHYPSPRSVHTTYDSHSSYGNAPNGYVSDSTPPPWHHQAPSRQVSYSSTDPVSPPPQYQYQTPPATAGLTSQLPLPPPQQVTVPPSSILGSGPQSAPPTHSVFLTDASRRTYRITRPRRAPRRLTTKEEANFQCEVKGCGKLFSRSYNFKAHMETHDEKREYPFPCTLGACNKKFVRKTDLQRHHHSVHMKERNHKCDYCSRMFARKDTLRRHMEDGCSKRFDIGVLDVRGENTFDPMHPSVRSMGPLNMVPPQGLPPMAIPPLVSAIPPLSMRRDLVAGGDGPQGHSWGR